MEERKKSHNLPPGTLEIAGDNVITQQSVYYSVGAPVQCLPMTHSEDHSLRTSMGHVSSVSAFGYSMDFQFREDGPIKGQREMESLLSSRKTRKSIMSLQHPSFHVQKCSYIHQFTKNF